MWFNLNLKEREKNIEKFNKAYQEVFTPTINYIVKVRCTNCGYIEELAVPQGKKVYECVCSVCKCTDTLACISE